eukprot:UN02820
MEPFEYSYTERDVVIYNLGIGFGLDECISNGTLQNTYESHEDFGIFPSFCVVPPFKCIANVVGLPKLVFNPMMLLHGETEFILHKPASQQPTNATLLTHGIVTGCYDKKSGASLEITANTVNPANNNEVLFTNIMTLFIRGLGNFGGPSGPANVDKSKIIPLAIPKNETPFATKLYQLTQQQALLYRLSGDLNPLHVDPQLAALGGFKKQPILHGLCTLGFSVRAVVATVCDDNRDLISRVKCRFIKPVLPGQTLVVDVYSPTTVNNHKNVVYFQTRVKDQEENNNTELPVVLIGFAVLNLPQDGVAKM